MAYAALVFFVLLVGVVFFLGRAGKNAGHESGQAKEPELTGRFLLGRYMQGIPGQHDPVAVVSCAVTPTDFLVCKGTAGDEILRIDRSRVTGICLTEDEGASYRLELSWNDSDAVHHTARFRFDNKREAGALARAALETLQQWQRPVQNRTAAVNA